MVTREWIFTPVPSHSHRKKSCPIPIPGQRKKKKSCLIPLLVKWLPLPRLFYTEFDSIFSPFFLDHFVFWSVILKVILYSDYYCVFSQSCISLVFWQTATSLNWKQNKQHMCNSWPVQTGLQKNCEFSSIHCHTFNGGPPQGAWLRLSIGKKVRK